jgi:hypothetical protein
LRSSSSTFVGPVSAQAAPLGGWKHWSETMSYNARCWTRQAAALAAAMIFLTGCEGVGFDATVKPCPPVVEYSRAEQAIVAEELAAMPQGAMIENWLADYTVLREQVRACQ